MVELNTSADSSTVAALIEQWRQQDLVGHAPTRQGSMMYFRNDKGALTQSLLAYGEWAEHEIALCRRFIGKGDIVLDVGAYIGTHSRAFAECVGSAGHVYSIEAQPASFTVLSQNVSTACEGQITAINAAVSGPGAATSLMLDEINIAASQSFGSAALSSGGSQPTRSELPTITLDSLALSSCALIKLDVEGMEDQVLAGAAKLISSCTPVIYAECNSVDAGSRVAARLRAYGYDVWMHLAEAFNSKNWRANSTNIFGNAREAALLGMPPGCQGVCESLIGQVEGLLFKVETLDDLVAGMLMKPQYPREVLQFTTACRAGGRHG